MNPPTALSFQPEGIPDAVKELNRWVAWDYTLRGNRWTKPPKNARTGRLAATNNPETWCDFDTVARSVRSGIYDGAGLVLPAGIVGVDLDKCYANGRYDDQAQLIMGMIPSYRERSPSGTGVKFLVAGHLNDDLRKINEKLHVELYDGQTTNRYFALTGHREGEYKTITGQRDALYAIQTILSDAKRDTDSIDLYEPDKRIGKAREFLEHISAEQADDYSTWLHVGMALRWCGDELLEDWIRWSSSSAKFEEEVCRYKWDSFKRTDGALYTLSQLERLARGNGYRPDRYRTYGITGDKLLAKTIVRDYLVKDFMTAKEPMVIGGASKTLKTTIALDLAVSLASGSPFLGVLPVLKRQRVMFLSGESGEATLQENLQLIVNHRELTSDQLSTLTLGFRLPKLDRDSDVEDLLEEIKEQETDVVFVDPLYRSLRVGDDAGNIFKMGEHLEQIAEQVHRAGVTVVLLHHFRKQGRTWGESPELEDLSQAGLGEFGRQFLLIKRRKQYQLDGKHDLWFSWGGSAGHQSLQMLEAFTGTRNSGLTWQPVLRSLQDWEQTEAEARKMAKEAEDEETKREADGKVKAQIYSFLETNTNVSISRIRDEFKIGNSVAQRVLENGLDAGELVVESKKRGGNLWSLASVIES